MTKNLALIAALAAVAFTTSASAQSMVKIGTVDMKKVFDGYYKTKDAESRINEQRNSAKKELDDRMDVYQKGVADVKKLEDEIQKPELSKESKDKKMKEREEKINELKLMEREVGEFRQSREKQLQEQSVRMRAGIVEDINKVITDIVKAENYDVVFDKSGPTLNGVPSVLFSKDAYEFTSDVIKNINANKGKEPVAAEEKPVDKPAEKPADKKK